MTHPDLKTSIVVDDGRHNGFPDLIHWRGYFYLAFRSARTHIDKNSSIRLLRSRDSKDWEPVTEFHLTHEDLRDPKFALIAGRIFLYALKNREISAAPYTTICSSSVDGQHWSEWQEVCPPNWVFWRPKTHDGQTWYVAADERGQNRSALFSSTDGVVWNRISTIYSGGFNAEVELAFLEDRELHCTIRVEGLGANSRTLLGSSRFPYSSWELVSSHLTRLDGAASFTYKGQVYSVGRFEPTPVFGTGNCSTKNAHRYSPAARDVFPGCWISQARVIQATEPWFCRGILPSLFTTPAILRRIIRG